MPNAATIHQLEVKARHVAQFTYGRGRDHKDTGIAKVACEHGVEAGGDRVGLLRGVRPLVPVMQANKQGADVLPAPAEVKPGDSEHRTHTVLLHFQQVLRGTAQGGLRPFCGGPGRCLYLREQHALIFLRQERGRNAGKQPAGGNGNHQINQYQPTRAAQTAHYRSRVIAVGPLDAAVKPAKETFACGMLSRLYRLEQRSAQRRGKHHRHHHRQHHRGDNGDGELPVDHAG
ncbi:hypothetical protein D3C80_632780 [compost metagenome]